MLIEDQKEKYTLTVDEERRVVFENPTGLWTKEDMKRFQDDYINKILPLFKNKIWTKCTDMRGYRTSNITEEIREHLQWAAENGMKQGAIIVESAIKKSQMKRSNEQLAPKPFTSKEKADEWLKSQGF